MIQFDEHFQQGWNMLKPPTSNSLTFSREPQFCLAKKGISPTNPTLGMGFFDHQSYSKTGGLES